MLHVPLKAHSVPTALLRSSILAIRNETQSFVREVAAMRPSTYTKRLRTMVLEMVLPELSL